MARVCLGFIDVAAGAHFFHPTRRKECRLVISNKRLTTQWDGKRGPALRVASEKAPLGVTPPLFGITKPRSSCLDWRFFRRNSDIYET